MSYVSDTFKSELIEQVKDLLEIYNVLTSEHRHEKDVILFNLAVVAGTLAYYCDVKDIPVLNESDTILQAGHERLRAHFLSKKETVSNGIDSFLKEPTKDGLKALNEIFIVAEKVDEEEAFLDDFGIATKTIKAFSDDYTHLKELAKKLKTKYRFFDDEILDAITS